MARGSYTSNWNFILSIALNYILRLWFKNRRLQWNLNIRDDSDFFLLNGYTILIKFPNEKLKKKSFKLIIVGWKILKWYNCNFFNTDNQLKSSLGYYYPRNSRSYKLDISLLFHLIWIFFLVNLIFGSVIKIYLFFIFKL